MDGIFGVIDDTLKLSIVDSTMMSIVHRAMNKAHERVNSREGVIERLHEISKFYELSIMQLDGCIEFVQEETDTYNRDRSYEEVLAGLDEIRNRLQRRLYESELAILQKDRELADRFESESSLRRALEITERELVSSQEDLEIARSGNLSPRESEEGEFCELKDSLDRQVLKIREKLESDDSKPKLMQRNRRSNDVKVEKMGSDIDILKETLDVAFGKMHSAIFCSEMGPIEHQIKSSIENDVISICLKGFVRNSHEDLQAETKKKERQILYLVNQVRELCEDLKPLIIQNGEECNSLDFGSKTPKGEDKNFQVDFDDTLSESRVSSKSIRLQQVLEKMENLIVLNSKINKSLGQNGNVKENMQMHNQIASNEMPWNRRECPQLCNGAKLQFPIIHYKFEAQTKGEETSTEEHKVENLLREEISWFIFSETIKSMTYKAFFDDFLRDLRVTIGEDVGLVFLREMAREWEEKMEAIYMETSLREEICYTILNEAVKEVSKRYKLKLHNMQLSNSDSKCLKFLEFQQFFSDFELMTNQKVEATIMRLEEMKHSLDQLPQAMVSLRENESLYQKAFLIRCQNLRKAEYEVDLLGDEVDKLHRLIEKIYLIMNQHSPVLQQYFDVSEFLRFIKMGLTQIFCTPSHKLHTTIS